MTKPMAAVAGLMLMEGFGPDIHLTRTQTILQGAGHYDFRYKRSNETD